MQPATVVQVKPAPSLDGDREALLGCAVGKKGIGKTFTTLKILYQYVRGNPAAGVKGRKVLIFDVNDEYSDIKAISVSAIAQFSNQVQAEIRRVRVFKDVTGEKMSVDEMAATLNDILSNYHSGLILIEDISRYVADSYSKDLIGNIVTQRHRACDIIIHYQTVGRIAHPKIFGNLNYLRFHKCADTVERHKTKFAGETDHLKLAEALVNTQHRKGNERFYCYVNFDKNKVAGNFTAADFHEAINYFLQENYNDTIRPLINQRDLKGKKVYTHESAVNELRSKLFTDYYGGK